MKKALVILLVVLLLPIPSALVMADSGGWTWINPLPQGNALRAVWGTAPDNVYAAGDLGTFLRYDGTSWQVVSNLPGTNALYDLWGTSPDNIFAVGYNALWHYNGHAWRALTPPPKISPFLMRGVWGTSWNNVYAVGYSTLPAGPQATVLHYDGRTWSGMALPPSFYASELYDVWGSGPNDIFAVGEYGSIIHYDGTSWKKMSLNNEKIFLYSVWGSGPKDVYAAGYIEPWDGVVYHYDGKTWQEVYRKDSRFYDIWGLGPNDVYVLDDWGHVYHYDGQSWQEGPSVTKRIGNIYSLWGTGPDNLFAVGDHGIIAHYDGTQWQDQVRGPRFRAYGAWTDGTHTVIVGGGPTAFVHNGTKWFRYTSNLFLPIYGLLDVWGTAWNDLYATGEGIILHFDGSQWKRMTTVMDDENSPAQLNGIWGSGPNDIYAVGGWTYPDRQIILHFNGYQWLSVYRREGPPLLDVWSSGPNDVFVAAGEGGMLHYDGRSWRRMTTGNFSFTAVWGTGPNNVYATAKDLDTGNGVVLHYNGAGWRTIYAEYLRLNHIWGRGPNDIYAVGVSWPTYDYEFGNDQGEVLHYNGSRWTYLPTPLFYSVEKVTGAENVLLLIGWRGSVLARGNTPPPLTTWETVPPVPYYLETYIPLIQR